MKYKKRTLEERLSVCKMIEIGLSGAMINKLTGVHPSLQKIWYTNYQQYGVQGLEKRQYRVYTEAEKMHLLREYRKKDVPLLSFCVEHKVSHIQFKTWYRTYFADNLTFASTKASTVRQDIMKGKDNAKNKEIDLQQLSKEELINVVTYLRDENKLLKKVKALMEERMPKERKTWHKPSKH